MGSYCLPSNKRKKGATMSLELYTRNIPLTQKAKFWGNYVSALKGNADLCAAPEARVLNFYPSITQTIPPTYPDLRNEFGKLENLLQLQFCQPPMTGYIHWATTTALSTLRFTDLTGTRLSEDVSNFSRNIRFLVFGHCIRSINKKHFSTTIKYCNKNSQIYLYDTLLPRIYINLTV